MFNLDILLHLEMFFIHFKYDIKEVLDNGCFTFVVDIGNDAYLELHNAPKIMVMKAVGYDGISTFIVCEDNSFKTNFKINLRYHHKKVYDMKCRYDTIHNILT